MSSRALRRLEKQKLEQLAKLEKEQTPEEKEEEDEQEEESYTPAFNAFALLNEEESDSDSEEKQEEEEDELKEDSKPEVTTVPVTTKKSRKKKTKKKKSKSKAPEPEAESNSDEDLDKFLAEFRQKEKKDVDKKPEAVDIEEGYDFEEEYDQQVDPVEYYDSNFKYFTSKKLKQSIPFLSIKSIKNLDPDHELSNLFGKLSSETIEDANNTSSLATSPEVLAQFKKLARLTRGWSGKDRRNVPGTTRKLLLTRIKDDYLPTAQKPLAMEELTTDDVVNLLHSREEDLVLEELEAKVEKELRLGVRYFQFNKIHSVQDRVANTRFYASVVMTPDPDSLMQLLQQHPYHEETLLQVAMVMLRQGGDKSVSNALVEKCLFVFDRSLHKRFHELLSEANNGLIRLPYEGFVNRQFYLCVFRYIINLGERSMFYTALHYCKFLLSFCPTDDPLGVRYFIDFYAILSEEFEYLTKLVESPLVTTYRRWLTPGLAFSSALAYLHLGDTANAKKRLKIAYDLYPYTSYQLLETVGRAEYIGVKESDLPVNKEINLAGQTYLVRAAAVWKDLAHIQFLHDELSRLFQNFPVKQAKPSLASSIYNIFSSTNSSEETKSLPINLLRFGILSGENKIMAAIPQEIFARNDTFEYDVLPPTGESKDYDEYTGVSGASKLPDSLLLYVDQNMLGAIIQNRTEQSDFDEIIRQLQAQALEEEAAE